MAPEQLDSSRNADMTSDIWALGAILFELLTGDVPFDGDTLQELRRRIRAERPLALRSLRPEAPRALEAIVERCLEKDPKRRYQNVAELAAALAGLASARARLSVSRIHRMIEGAGLSSTLPQDLGPPEPTNAMPGTRRSLAHTWARIPRWPAAAGLVVLVMVLAGLSSFLQHSADPKASAPAQPRESKARPPASASAAPGDWQAVARPGSDWKSR
jgi:serine/threonine protein kinase